MWQGGGGGVVFTSPSPIPPFRIVLSYDYKRMQFSRVVIKKSESIE